MRDASKHAPRAIVLPIYVCAITGFIFPIAVCFCIGDIKAIAFTTTSIFLIQIYFDSTNSLVASCILATLIVIIDFACANALLAEGSRSLYAFARDRGLPFSGSISKIEKKHQVPVVSILLSTVIQMAFNSIYFGTATGFNIVIATSSPKAFTSPTPCPYLCVSSLFFPTARTGSFPVLGL